MGSKPTKLSPQQIRVLTNLSKGLEACDHCRKQADYGGLDGTIRSLVARGLMTQEGELTAAGKKAVTPFKDDDDE